MGKFRTKHQHSEVDEVTSLLSQSSPLSIAQRSMPKITAIDLLKNSLPKIKPSEKPKTPLKRVTEAKPRSKPAPRTTKSVSPQQREEDSTPRQRREHRLVPEIPPLTPASQWEKDELPNRPRKDK